MPRPPAPKPSRGPAPPVPEPLRGPAPGRGGPPPGRGGPPRPWPRPTGTPPLPAGPPPAAAGPAAAGGGYAAVPPGPPTRLEALQPVLSTPTITSEVKPSLPSPPGLTVTQPEAEYYNLGLNDSDYSFPASPCQGSSDTNPASWSAGYVQTATVAESATDTQGDSLKKTMVIGTRQPLPYFLGGPHGDKDDNEDEDKDEDKDEDEDEDKDDDRVTRRWAADENGWR
jgi:hypothetical protein